MLRYQKLRRRRALLRQMTGLALEAFDALTEQFGPLWHLAERQRLSRPGRRNALGAGRPYALASVQDKLLMFLLVCRQGITFELAGCLFGLDASNVRKLFRKITPLVQQAADPELADGLAKLAAAYARQDGKIGTLDALLLRCPELSEVAGDTTCQKRRRPGKKAARRKSYSGKHKAHMLKVLTVVDKHRRIRFVSGSYPGKTHDAAIYRDCRIGELLPRQTKQFWDLGFQGLAQDYPEHDLRLPYKRSSPGCKGKGKTGPPLTRGQKQANTLRRKRRVPVEHHYADLKGFGVLGGVWRAAEARHHEVFSAVAAVSNFRRDYRLTHATAG